MARTLTAACVTVFMVVLLCAPAFGQVQSAARDQYANRTTFLDGQAYFSPGDEVPAGYTCTYDYADAAPDGTVGYLCHPTQVDASQPCAQVYYYDASGYPTGTKEGCLDSIGDWGGDALGTAAGEEAGMVDDAVKDARGGGSTGLIGPSSPGVATGATPGPSPASDTSAPPSPPPETPAPPPATPPTTPSGTHPVTPLAAPSSAPSEVGMTQSPAYPTVEELALAPSAATPDEGSASSPGAGGHLQTRENDPGSTGTPRLLAYSSSAISGPRASGKMPGKAGKTGAGRAASRGEGRSPAASGRDEHGRGRAGTRGSRSPQREPGSHDLRPGSAAVPVADHKGVARSDGQRYGPRAVHPNGREDAGRSVRAGSGPHYRVLPETGGISPDAIAKVAFLLGLLLALLAGGLRSGSRIARWRRPPS